MTYKPSQQLDTLIGQYNKKKADLSLGCLPDGKDLSHVQLDIMHDKTEIYTYCGVGILKIFPPVYSNTNKDDGVFLNLTMNYSTMENVKELHNEKL